MMSEVITGTIVAAAPWILLEFLKHRDRAAYRRGQWVYHEGGGRDEHQDHEWLRGWNDAATGRDLFAEPEKSPESEAFSALVLLIGYAVGLVKGPLCVMWLAVTQ